MSEKRIIVILANSIRNKRRCIAGKELKVDGRGYVGGSWIRLADPSTDDTSLPEIRTLYKGGGSAQVLDIVEVTVSGHCADRNHPEDWWLEKGTRLEKIGQYEYRKLPLLQDKPQFLWHGPGAWDSVPAGYVQRMQFPASLYLIAAPLNWTFSFWKEDRAAAQPGAAVEERKVRQLTLVYSGQKHSLSVTDPEFNWRHKIFDRMEKGMVKTLEVRKPEQHYFCLSLTPAMNNRQYKVCATIIEPPNA